MQHRALSVLFLGLIAAGAASAQTATIRGFVLESSTGLPMQGVNVYLEQDSRLINGVATDSDGLYTLARIPVGRYVLKASFIGYTTYADTLRLQQQEDIYQINITLEPDASEMGEVTVEAQREREGMARVVAGQQTVQPRDIEMVPTVDVSGDLAAFITTLPGVITTGDRGGQLFIRGGEPWQNLVLLDGMVVYQPFHILGFFSAFPVDIISQADVYAGGFGSRFGGRLSSVIDVATRPGNKKAYGASVSVAPFVSSVLLEGPLTESDRFSGLVSFRQSVIEQGASRIVDDDLPYRFGDVFAKVHGNITPNNQTSFTYMRTYDRGRVFEGTADDPRANNDVGDTPLIESSFNREQDIRWMNEAYGGRHLILPRKFPIAAELLVSYSRFQTEFGPPDDALRTSKVGRINGEANVTYFAGPLEVNWGMFVNTIELSSELGGLFQDQEIRQEFLTTAGLYIEPEFEVNPNLQVRAGLRLNGFASRARAALDPRLRAIWTKGRHEVSAAFGIYHQEIAGLSDRRDAASIFTAWAPVPFGRLPRATHFILGYRTQLTPWLEAASEGFFKRMRNLYVAEWTAFPRLTTRLQPADGIAFGMDLRFDLRLRNLYGYVTYGLSFVEYEARQSTLLLWYGSETLRYTPPHDRRHQINALLSTTLVGFDLSARWQFGSGLPFNRALGFDGFVLLDGDIDPFTEPGSRRVIYERPFNGRLPTYHRLDVSAERPFRIGSLEAKALISVINVYDRRNLFYLDVFTLRRADQLPFIPTFGLKIDLTS